MKMAVLASGTGSNARKIFEEHRAGRFKNTEIVALICDVPEAPVLKIAEEFGVETVLIDGPFKGPRFTSEAAKAYADALRRVGADFVVLAGFMKIVPPEIVELFERRMINLHPSLLPAFKGKDAMKQAWDYGVKIGGCSVHYVSNALDSGEIVAQKAVEILPSDTLESFRLRVHAAEHELLPSVIAGIASAEQPS